MLLSGYIINKYKARPSDFGTVIPDLLKKSAVILEPAAQNTITNSKPDIIKDTNEYKKWVEATCAEERKQLLLEKIRSIEVKVTNGVIDMEFYDHDGHPKFDPGIEN